MRARFDSIADTAQRRGFNAISAGGGVYIDSGGRIKGIMKFVHE